MSFWVVAAILVFSPFPFASVGSVWTYLYGIFVGIGLIAFVIERWQGGREIPPVPGVLAVSGVLVLLVAIWGFVQAIPGLFPALQHPIWAETAELLELSDLKGYLTLMPERTSETATRYLIYLGFALLLVWHSRRKRNVELLLKIFVGAQAVYALYGMTVYFAGADMILWFEKTSYHGVLTSTFVNRNSYATYAGLGALTAFALMLRYLRQTLGAERSRRSKLRDLIETTTSRGWLLPVALALCFVAVLLTESRMGLFAMLIAISALLAGWVARLPGGQTRTFGTLLLLAIVGMLTINIMLSGDLAADRFARLFEDGDGRFNVYPLVLEAISERPWIGYGLGAFEDAFRPFRDETVVAHFDKAHSDYLEMIMDVGWPAALAMFSAFALVLMAAFRASRTRTDYELALLSFAATVQIAAHSAVDFSLQIPAVVFAYMVVALSGVAYLASNEASRSKAPERPRSAFGLPLPDEEPSAGARSQHGG